MKILIIAVQYPPSGETGAKRPWLFAKELQKLGHRVTVLSQENLLDAKRPNKLVLQRGSFGERILRVMPFGFPGISDASFQVFWSMRSVILRCRHLHKCDVAILTGPPFFHFLLVSAIKRLGIPVVLDYRDGWGANPYPYRSVKDCIFRLFGRIVEPALYRHASAAVFISESLRSDYLSVMRIQRNEKTYVVPNGVDVAEFNLAKPRELKTELRLPGEVCLFVYPGSLNPDIEADSFARHLNAILRRSLPDLQYTRFVFIGPSTQYSRYFDSDILNNYVFFMPSLSLKESYACIKGADVLLSLGGNQTQRLNRKIFEYAIASRPVFHVGSPKGETAGIVRRYNLGVIVPSDDPQALEDGLRKIMLEPRSSLPRQDLAKRSFPFSTEEITKSYLRIIERLPRHA
jgi:glycosyltransferase involved in cell wall biosynthesis